MDPLPMGLSVLGDANGGAHEPTTLRCASLGHTCGGAQEPTTLGSFSSWWCQWKCPYTHHSWVHLHLVTLMEVPMNPPSLGASPLGDTCAGGPWTHHPWVHLHLVMPVEVPKDPPWECGVTMAPLFGDTHDGAHGPSTLSCFQRTPAPHSQGWTPSRCSGSWRKWLCTSRNLWCCRQAPSASPGP